MSLSTIDTGQIKRPGQQVVGSIATEGNLLLHQPSGNLQFDDRPGRESGDHAGRSNNYLFGTSDSVHVGVA